MSKFIDMLEKAGTQPPTPMGFGLASPRNDSSRLIVVVGQASPEQLKKKGKLSEAQVDAILLSVDSWEGSSLERAGGALGDLLWGARAGGLDGERVEDLKSKGCDFVVFDADDTAAEVLNDEELGKVIAVDHDLTEERARAIQELPVDGVLLSPFKDLSPLTVQKLIGIQLVRGLIDKPFVMTLDSLLGHHELESLRNMGVAGLALDLSHGKAIGAMKEDIAGLPRRKPSAKGGDIVTLPGTGASEPHSQPDEEDDEEEW